MEYFNKWNINMNTLDLAEYNIKEPVKAYGFAVKKNAVVTNYLFFDENECVMLWYNYHCKDIDMISELHEIVLDAEYTEDDIEQAKKQLLNQQLCPITKKLNTNILYLDDLQYSLIWHGVSQGSEKDIVTEELMKQYGYGLVYWTADQLYTFYDNRMAVMFRKLRELKQQGIYPICIRLPKKNNQPIQVADGRKLLIEMAIQENLKGKYDELQKLCNINNSQ